MSITFYNRQGVISLVKKFIQDSSEIEKLAKLVSIMEKCGIGISALDTVNSDPIKGIVFTPEFEYGRIPQAIVDETLSYFSENPEAYFWNQDLWIIEVDLGKIPTVEQLYIILYEACTEWLTLHDVFPQVLTPREIIRNLTPKFNYQTCAL